MTDESPASPEVPAGPGLDRHRADDGVYQPFNPAPMSWGKDPADGLPSPEISPSLPLAPPLSPETLVCLADTSEFVLRSRRWGEVVGRFEPHAVKRAPNGDYFVAIEVAIESGAPLLDILRAFDIRTARVRVEPKRPQCRFLAQQMTDFQDEAKHQFLERLCTARRDDERFFLGLRDSQMFACELREPRDRVSEERIEKMNEVKIMLGRERTAEQGGGFDVDKALAQKVQEAEKEGLTESSIFGDRKE